MMANTRVFFTLFLMSFLITGALSVDHFYKVMIKIANRYHAGTDATVWVRPKGEKGLCNWITMHTFDHTIVVNGAYYTMGKMPMDCGDLKSIELMHDDGGSGPDFCPEYVTVLHASRHKLFRFNGKGGSACWVTTYPSSLMVSSPTLNVKTVTYNITAKTGNIQYAGTNGNVYLSIGSSVTRKQSMHYFLDTPKDNFQLGATESFVFRDMDIGQISYINVYVEDDGWYYSKLEIVVVEKEKIHYFGAGWVSSDTTRKLYTLCVTNVNEKKITYKVSTRTTDNSNGKMYLKLFGDDGDESYEHLLKEDGMDVFEKGNSNIFLFKDYNIKQIKHIVIEKRGSTNSWYFDMISVVAVDNKMRFEFGSGILGEVDPPKTFVTATIQHLRTITYKVTTKVKDEENAGSKADIYLKIITFNGDASVPFKLHTPKGLKIANTYNFEFEDCDVGHIKEITFRTVSQRGDSDWSFETFDIDAVEHNMRYHFGDGLLDEKNRTALKKRPRQIVNIS